MTDSVFNLKQLSAPKLPQFTGTDFSYLTIGMIQGNFIGIHLQPVVTTKDKKRFVSSLLVRVIEIGKDRQLQAFDYRGPAHFKDADGNAVKGYRLAKFLLPLVNAGAGILRAQEILQQNNTEFYQFFRQPIEQAGGSMILDETEFGFFVEAAFAKFDDSNESLFALPALQDIDDEDGEDEDEDEP